MAGLRYKNSEEKRKTSVNGKSTAKTKHHRAKSSATPNLGAQDTSPHSVTIHSELKSPILSNARHLPGTQRVWCVNMTTSLRLNLRKSC